MNESLLKQARAGKWRSWRALLLTGAVALALCVPLLIPLAVSQAQTSAQGAQTDNPRAGFWREVRHGDVGYTTADTPDADVLIQNGGQNWRQLRNGPIANYGGWLMGIVLVAIAVFLTFRGRIRVEAGPSDMRVIRFSLWQRIVHWFTATTFVILALTGLAIFYGRAVLIPIMGKDAFSVIAMASKQIHNFVGPLFVVAVLMLVVTFIVGNFYERGDIKWLLKGGGMVGKGHVSAGCYNFGEKSWFWLATIAGIVVAGSGLVLDFPNFGQSRELMQLAEMIHAITAVIFIAASFGHIYIGTVGMEGALDAMVKGHVDANWAKEHHDRWYESMDKQGNVKPIGEVEGHRVGQGAQHRTT
ncbi:MAG: formate dehydrogenase subunit gamma [Gammaproteobacteria bacterium]